MTLTSELLPAIQHYALLAVSVTLLSLTITQSKRRLPTWVWLAMVVLPVAQMAWSLWETVWETLVGENTVGQAPAELGSDAVAIVVQTLAHGLAIALVLAIVLHVVRQTSAGAMPKRVRLEPTV